MFATTLRLAVLILTCAAFAPTAVAECYKPKTSYAPEKVYKPKACPPPGKLIKNYCVTCEAPALLDVSHPVWCHTPCKPGYAWNAASKLCCRDTGSVCAGSFTVTTTTDAPHALPLDGCCTSTLRDKACTLRAAVQAANFLGAPQTIDLKVAGTYTLNVIGPNEDDAATGDLDIKAKKVIIANTSGGKVVISGPGGRANDRLFEVLGSELLGSSELAMSDVTLEHGDATTTGGGLEVHAKNTLTLSKVMLANNTANGGGAISNSGTATLTDVTFNGNTAKNLGGGLFNDGTASLSNVSMGSNSANAAGGILNSNTASLVLSNSTLQDNTAVMSAGGLSSNGIAELNNVTLSGNTSLGTGGGILIFAGTTKMTNVTMSNNSASVGGGIRIGGGTITLRNTLLANAPSGANCSVAGGTLGSAGSNLGNDNTCTAFFTAAGDLNNTNPLLGPLQINPPGTTATHALLPGSPAIDGVLNPCPPPATDQRGVSRPQGPKCDIGAFEVSPVGP
jgi:predicted outer membrane repeat protein